jgi:hypothetical protein
MRTAYAKPCQRTQDRFPTGGSLCPKSESATRDSAANGGRPELKTYTPVNIGNGPYRDNGKGVAARPLPYPLGQQVIRRLA